MERKIEEDATASENGGLWTDLLMGCFIVSPNDVVPDLDPAHKGEQVGVRILALDLRGYLAQLSGALNNFLS